MKNKIKFIDSKKFIVLVVVFFIVIASLNTYHSYTKVQDEQKNFALAESKILNDL